MAGQGVRFRRSVLLLGLLLLAGRGVGAHAVEEAAPENEVMLLGLVTRDEVEAAMPDWVRAVVEAQPDTTVASGMMTALEGAEVTVFFGTWCSDSGRELPRLWRALDEIGVLSPEEIRYVGVDRSKAVPTEWVDGKDLELIPTIVVSRAGKEVGRIVESSPHGIEVDLLALLRGEATGVITDSQDLSVADEDH